MRGVIVILALMYILSPIDGVPDFIPVVGWLDDVLAGVGGLAALMAKRK